MATPPTADNYLERYLGMILDSDKLVEALVAVAEMTAQAPHDFCGEQREFYLPRLAKAFSLLGVLFPREIIAAMGLAKHPDGTLIADDE